MEYNYQKLRGLIREHYGTLNSFANAVGIGSTTLNSRLNSSTFFNQREIEKISELLNLKKDEVNNIFFTHM